MEAHRALLYRDAAMSADPRGSHARGEATCESVAPHPPSVQPLTPHLKASSEESAGH